MGNPTEPKAYVLTLKELVKMVAAGQNFSSIEDGDYSHVILNDAPYHESVAFMLEKLIRFRNEYGTQQELYLDIPSDCVMVVNKSALALIKSSESFEYASGRCKIESIKKLGRVQ